MSNTIIETYTSSANYYIAKSSSKKIELSDKLKEHIENSSSQGKKLSKALKALSRNGESLSSLTSSDTSNDATITYKTGNEDVKTLVSSFNNLLKYSKNNSDNTELSKLYKSLKSYVKKKQILWNNLE